jgi:phosphoribosylformimino-5-aminoimidazole carboxamide ribotide isomerase
MQIIPAIDLIDGKCVRLTQGDYRQKKVYNAQPTEVAREFQDAGIQRLHLVDLDGAKAGKIVNLPVLESIASATSLIIDFGGGIGSLADLNQVFNAGASMATVGSLAVRQPELFHQWLADYGGSRILLGADVKGENIAISGWTESTAWTIIDFLASHLSHGLHQAFCTDISKDGLLQGPSLDLYRQILEQLPDLHLIASGGVSSIDDLAALQDIGCHGAIVGKAIYEGKITLNALRDFMA